MTLLNDISIICGDGAMAIAFTVFVMLTVLLAVFIILIFVSKPFRKFLFRKDYESTDDGRADEHTDATAAEQEQPPVTKQPKRKARAAEKEQTVEPAYNFSVPTVPLELVANAENEISEIPIAAKRKTNTLDDLRTVEIPETQPYKSKRDADRARFVTTTPRTGSRPRSDGAAHRAPPRKSSAKSTDKDGV